MKGRCWCSIIKGRWAANADHSQELCHQDVGFRAVRLLQGVRIELWSLGSGVWGLGFGVWGMGCAVWGSGFQVWDFGF